jgi:hypothetical protein
MLAERPPEYDELDPETVVWVRSSHRVEELRLLPALADMLGSQLPHV